MKSGMLWGFALVSCDGILLGLSYGILFWCFSSKILFNLPLLRSQEAQGLVGKERRRRMQRMEEIFFLFLFLLDL